MLSYGNVYRHYGESFVDCSIDQLQLNGWEVLNGEEDVIFSENGISCAANKTFVMFKKIDYDLANAQTITIKNTNFYEDVYTTTSQLQDSLVGLVSEVYADAIVGLTSPYERNDTSGQAQSGYRLGYSSRHSLTTRAKQIGEECESILDIDLLNKKIKYTVNIGDDTYSTDGDLWDADVEQIKKTTSLRMISGNSTKGGNFIKNYSISIRGANPISNVSLIGMSPGIYHNPDRGLISMTANGEDRLTISDKNLGATSTDVLSEDAQGLYYQWGNNHGFPSSGFNISSVRVDTQGYGPGNYYDSDTFITTSSNADWSISPNDDLRGGVTDTNDARRGPCPEGYHVPKNEEHKTMVGILRSLLGRDLTIQDYQDYLFIPLGGYLSYSSGKIFGSDSFHMWKSDNYAAGSYKNGTEISSSSLNQAGTSVSYNRRGTGHQIRPFKNMAVPPDRTWNVLLGDGVHRRRLIKSIYKGDEIVFPSKELFSRSKLRFFSDGIYEGTPAEPQSTKKLDLTIEHIFYDREYDRIWIAADSDIRIRDPRTNRSSIVARKKSRGESNWGGFVMFKKYILYSKNDSDGLLYIFDREEGTLKEIISVDTESYSGVILQQPHDINTNIVYYNQGYKQTKVRNIDTGEENNIFATSYHQAASIGDKCVITCENGNSTLYVINKDDERKEIKSTANTIATGLIGYTDSLLINRIPVSWDWYNRLLIGSTRDGTNTISTSLFSAGASSWSKSLAQGMCFYYGDGRGGRPNIEVFEYSPGGIVVSYNERNLYKTRSVSGMPHLVGGMDSDGRMYFRKFGGIQFVDGIPYGPSDDLGLRRSDELCNTFIGMIDRELDYDSASAPPTLQRTLKSEELSEFTLSTAAYSGASTVSKVWLESPQSEYVDIEYSIGGSSETTQQQTFNISQGGEVLLEVEGPASSKTTSGAGYVTGSARLRLTKGERVIVSHYVKATGGGTSTVTIKGVGYYY